MESEFEADGGAGADCSPGAFPRIIVNVFEKYMLLDDRPSHPMASFLEIDLQGPIEVPQLQQALPAALAQHPLLNATIHRKSPRNWDWVPGQGVPEIQLLSPSVPCPTPPEFDLESSPGLKIWMRPSPAGLTLILYVHHATCDAIGMLTFVMTWLKLAVGETVKTAHDPLRELTGREQYSRMTAAYPLRQRLRNITRYLFGQAPVALPVPRSNGNTNCDSLSSTYHVVRFTAEQTEQLKGAARAAQGSVNDWLTAALFQTVADWTQQSGAESNAGPWRLLVPVNRRDESQRFGAACNLIGYKMLTRTPREVGLFSRLMQSIRTEMAPVRENPRGVHSFVKMLRLLDRLGMLHRAVRQYDCFATVILSNLGDLQKYFSPMMAVNGHRLQAGDVTIDSIRCAPPRRPNTHLTIVALTYDRELQLMASRTSPGLNDEQTQQFLQMYHDRILNALAAGSSVVSRTWQGEKP